MNLNKVLPMSIIVLFVLGIGLLLLNNQSQKRAGSENINTIKVVASFYPLYEFALHVGSNRVTVINTTPAGTEPHDFEPTSQDIASIHAANIFLYNGSGFDPWAEKIEEELTQKGVTVVNLSKHIDLLENQEEDYEESQFDPHFWLDPVLAQKEAEVIRDALIKADPVNENEYKANSALLIGMLSDLDKRFQVGLASCQLREVVTSHAAFGYLANRYNFKQIGISGLSPDEEPSPQRMGEIAQLAQEKKIKYIFFETLVSPKLSETIANEIGAQTLVFNPLEGLTEEEIASGIDYTSIMEDNLNNLKIALSCQ